MDATSVRPSPAARKAGLRLALSITVVLLPLAFAGLGYYVYSWKDKCGRSMQDLQLILSALQSTPSVADLEPADVLSHVVAAGAITPRNASSPFDGSNYVILCTAECANAPVARSSVARPPFPIASLDVVSGCAVVFGDGHAEFLPASSLTCNSQPPTTRSPR